MSQAAAILVRAETGALARGPPAAERREPERQLRLAVAEERRLEWRLFRLWNFSREPKAFKLRPPLDAHVSLTAMSFQASFH